MQGTTAGVAAIGALEALTPWKFYAPPHAAVAVTLMCAPTLPKLGKFALALASACTAAAGMLQALGPGATTRSLTAGLALLFMKLTGTVNPVSRRVCSIVLVLEAGQSSVR